MERLLCLVLLTTALLPTNVGQAATIDLSFPVPVTIDPEPPIVVPFVDVNGDGLGDELSVTASDSVNLRVLLQNEQGGFDFDGLYPIHGFSHPNDSALYASIQLTGDFTGDGLPEVFVALRWGTLNCPGGSLAILFNDGAGNFGSTHVTTTYDLVESCRLSDLDGDNDLDLVVAVESVCGDPSGAAYVFTNDRNAAFTMQVYELFNDQPVVPIDLVDLDGDSSVDLLLGGAGVFLPNVGGLFGPPRTLGPPGARWIWVEELSGDARIDVLLSTPEELAVARNEGGGIFTSIVHAWSHDRNPVAVDLDVDGAMDFVVVDDPQVATFWNGGNGILQRTVVEVDNSREPPKWGDLDADGDPDLIVQDSTWFWHLRNEGDHFVVVARHPGVPLSVGDQDGDGVEDVVARIGGVTSLYRGMLDAGLRGGVYVDIGSSVISDLEVGQFTGDSYLDVVAQGSDDLGFNVFPGLGEGRFADPQFHSWGKGIDTGVRAIGKGDLNRDGRPDLVFAMGGYSVNLSGIGVVKATASRLESGVATFGTGTTPTALVVADFTEDGAADVVSNGWSPFTLFFRNDGTGTLADPELLNGDATRFAAADLDDDGHLDLLMETPSGVGVMTGNGDGTFDASILLFAGSEGVFAADLNNDALPDVVTGGRVYLNQGGLMFTASEPQMISAAVAGADLDDDGDVDLVSGGTLRIHQNNGEGTFSYENGHPSSFSAFRLGDFSGDGLADVFAYNVYFENRTDTSVPVLLHDLSARWVEEGVLLRWRLSEVGAVSEIRVFRASASEGPYEPVSQWIPATSTMEYLDPVRLPVSWYRIVEASANGPIVLGDISVNAASQLVTRLQYITQLTGRVMFHVTVGSEVAELALSLFDVRGRLVRSFPGNRLDPGVHVLEWDERDRQGRRVAPGVYFVTLRGGRVSDRGRFVLLR